MACQPKCWRSGVHDLMGMGGYNCIRTAYKRNRIWKIAIDWRCWGRIITTTKVEIDKIQPLSRKLIRMRMCDLTKHQNTHISVYFSQKCTMLIEEWRKPLSPRLVIYNIAELGSLRYWNSHKACPTQYPKKVQNWTIQIWKVYPPVEQDWDI